uniref:Calmin n=1 Tax=Molossus molossus TaxID=27622 RepID=A0A7J8JRR2_MOLMO|nr:calmin [Molossus molossus]
MVRSPRRTRRSWVKGELNPPTERTIRTSPRGGLAGTPDQKTRTTSRPWRRHRWRRSPRCTKRRSASPRAAGARRKGRRQGPWSPTGNCLPPRPAAASAWRPWAVAAKKAWISSPPRPCPRSPSSPTTSSTTRITRFPWLPFWRLMRKAQRILKTKRWTLKKRRTICMSRSPGRRRTRRRRGPRSWRAARAATASGGFARTPLIPPSRSPVWTAVQRVPNQPRSPLPRPPERTTSTGRLRTVPPWRASRNPQT